MQIPFVKIRLNVVLIIKNELIERLIEANAKSVPVLVGGDE